MFRSMLLVMCPYDGVVGGPHEQLPNQFSEMAINPLKYVVSGYDYTDEKIDEVAPVLHRSTAKVDLRALQAVRGHRALLERRARPAESWLPVLRGQLGPQEQREQFRRPG